MGAFRIGINMPGAISAGAYTAGVLDFLIEALDAWYDAKDKFRETGKDPVPMHDVSIPVFSGASAGGMCAAIASVMVQCKFDHIPNPNVEDTSNSLFESWVNKIDIRGLLGTDDLQGGGPLISLLDCTVIDQIAEAALKLGQPMPRRYIPSDLTLFLTLTNLTGIPYVLDDVGNIMNVPSAEEGVLYHADRLRFQTVTGNAPTSDPTAKALPLDNSDDERWNLLRTAAKATGAFPIFLAPREIVREKSDYEIPLWESLNPAVRPKAKNLIQPAWKEQPAQFNTINVDGGVIDNDPFNLAHDYLASLEPQRKNNQNPRQALKADRAVVTIAPFPSQMTFNSNPQYPADAALGAALGGLASSLIASSRFFGESLQQIVKGGTSSRFMVAPSDEVEGTQVYLDAALQCGSLGAFGGFFEKGFRQHDFALGRRNCQQFLRKYFVLPEKNPIIDAGLQQLGARRIDLPAKFTADPPVGRPSPKKRKWIQVIPLCDGLDQEVPSPERGQISESKLSDIADLMYKRFGKVVPKLAENLHSWLLRWPLDEIVKVLTHLETGKGDLVKQLQKALAGPVNG
jgi:hypothetical protein